MEVGGHRLVIGDALGIVALHDTDNLVRCINGFLLYDLIVADDAENDFRRYYRQSGNLVICEKLVRNLDDTFVSNLLRRVDDTDGDETIKNQET